MKTRVGILFILLVMISCGHEQETLWEELDDQAATLYQQGRYAEAIEVAEKALNVAREAFGADHSNVAVSLNNIMI